ncbi:PE-PPE domain-containing protein, partial [Mycobacterium sp.]|uniref:PE-PPE domain-containing protein n=1 Tax=Mycobacterium sp. TaxID=1785 RepID=UPI0031D6AEA5
MTTGLFASAGAGLLSLTSVMNSAFAYADPVTLIIGGSGIPIPPPEYISDAFTKFIEPQFGDLGFTQPPTGLFTPEQLYPIYPPPGPEATVVKQLPFATSVYQDTQILDQTIETGVKNGDTFAVYGESQSSTVSGLAMTDLNAAGVPSSDVHFALVGDPDTPFGGLLTRF